jgi:hypothetical protein
MQGLRCLPALAAFALAGCGIAPGIFGNPPRYIDSPVYPKPRLEVLTTVIEVLERQGYRVQSVSEGRQIEAAKVRLSPFNKEGKRWKASVKLDSDVDGTVIHLMIEAEVNKNIQAPLDEVSADWGSADFDTAEEEMMLSMFGMKIMPPKLPPPGTRNKGR